MEGCSFGTLEKCYGFDDEKTPENMIEVRISLNYYDTVLYVINELFYG